MLFIFNSYMYCYWYSMVKNMTERFEILTFETIDEKKLRRTSEKKERDKKLKEIENNGFCEYCGGREKDYKKDPEWIPAMTRYHWDEDKEPLNNPNRDIFLCSTCQIEYTEHWKEMWNEYYYGLL